MTTRDVTACRWMHGAYAQYDIQQIAKQIKFIARVAHANEQQQLQQQQQQQWISTFICIKATTTIKRM